MIGMNIGAIAGIMNSTRAIGRMSRQRMKLGSWFGFGPSKSSSEPDGGVKATWRIALQAKLPKGWRVREFTCYHTHIYFEGFQIAECTDSSRYWRTVNQKVTELLLSVGEDAYLDVPDSSMGMTRTDVPPFPFKDVPAQPGGK